MRCHGTKCPQLTAFFSLSSFSFTYFSTRRSIVGFQNFAWDFNSHTHKKLGWDHPCPLLRDYLLFIFFKHKNCSEMPEMARKLIRILFCTQIFPCRFLAVSLHKSILLYIRTSHSRGNVSSLKTQDLGAFQKSNPKAGKSKFIKEKLKKIREQLSSEGRQTKLCDVHTLKVNKDRQLLLMLKLHNMR